MNYRCPNCQAELEPVDQTFRCTNGHSFDLSRDGYVNLLPAGRLSGGPAGDSAEMIRSRRDFFDQGHYSPVMAAVAAMVGPADSLELGAVLDAGCGEGSYLAVIDAPVRHGIDVSKPAVRLAGRRHRDDSWAVASSYRLPFADAAFDAVVSVFAPRPYRELRRVLRLGGAIVTASPGPDHLSTLRGLLYDEPHPHEDRPHVTEEGFGSPAERERVTFDLHLDATDSLNLLEMTPYWWSATPGQQSALGPVDTTVDIWVARHEIA